MDARGIDLHDPGWVNRELQKIRREIESLRSERRAAATTITDGDLILRGGGKLVVDGGDFLLLDTDGSTVFRLGPQEFNDRGVSIYREDGEPVLEVSKPSSGAGQSWRMKDSGGTVIVGESGFGEGLGRPRIPLRPFPTATPAYGMYGPEVSTTSATFETVFAVQDRRQNPLWAPAFRVKCSDATTAAEIRVWNPDASAALLEFGIGTWTGVRPLGNTNYTELTPALVALTGSDDVGSRFRFEVQARRTAGAGTVTVAIPESIGG